MSALSASSLRSPSASLTGVFAAHILQQPLAGVGAAGFQRAHLVEQAQALGLQFVQAAGRGASSSRLARRSSAWRCPGPPARRRPRPAWAASPRCARRRAGRPRRAPPGFSTGMPVASAGTGWPSWSMRERRQLVVDDLLQAAAAAGVEARLQGHGLRAGAQARLLPLARRPGALRARARARRTSSRGAGRFAALAGARERARDRRGAGACRRLQQRRSRRGQQHAGLLPGKAGQARLFARVRAVTRASSRESSTAPSTPSMAATRHSAGATPPSSSRKSTRRVPGRGMVRAMWLKRPPARRGQALHRACPRAARPPRRNRRYRRWFRRDRR